MHFSAFLPLFLLCREKILCFFLLLLSFKTNLEAYPLLLSCLLDVHLLLFSLQPQTIFSRARFTRFSNPQKKHGSTVGLFVLLRFFLPLVLSLRYQNTIAFFGLPFSSQAHRP